MVGVFGRSLSLFVFTTVLSSSSIVPVGAFAFVTPLMSKVLAVLVILSEKTRLGASIT